MYFFAFKFKTVFKHLMVFLNDLAVNYKCLWFLTGELIKVFVLQCI
jgi:hypothetical protein